MPAPHWVLGCEQAHRVSVQQVQDVSVPHWELDLVMEKSFRFRDNLGWKGAQSSLAQPLAQSRASFEVKANSEGKSCSPGLVLAGFECLQGWTSLASFLSYHSL